MNKFAVQKVEHELHNRLLEERSSVNATLQGWPIGGESLGGQPREVSLAFNQQLAAKLRLIERALERQRQGTYGNCAHCGAPIWERLQIRPYAEYCTGCQTRIERGLIPRPTTSRT